MGNIYGRKHSRWLLLAGLVGILAQAKAQTPVVQWQRYIDVPGLTADTRVRATRVSSGAYAVLVGTSVSRLLNTGEISWTQTLTGAYSDSTRSYVGVRQTIALTPTADDGVAVLALDQLNRYYVAKLTAGGQTSWIRPVERAGSGASLTNDALTTAADGSLLMVGSFGDVRTYLTLTAMSPEGYVTGQWRIRFPDSTTARVPTIAKALPTNDGGFLLIGKSTDRATGVSQGLAIKLSKAYQPVWQMAYPAYSTLRDVVADTATDDQYTAIGELTNAPTQALTIRPNGNGGAIFTLPAGYTSIALANDGAPYRTLLGASSQNQGDFRLISTDPQAAFRWTKTLGGSGQDIPSALLPAADGGYLVAGTTTSTDGDVAGRTTRGVAAWIVKLGRTAVATTLALQAPAYQCQTGAIVFRTTGGDGTPIVYQAPGIRRANVTDNFGTVEAELRGDPKPITIQATQSGQMVSYVFDFGAYCRQPAADTATVVLKLLTPTYNCQSGAITFHAVGKAGVPIEFAAPGITGWTTNPNQFVDTELRTANDAVPITLMARQGDAVATYIFNIKAVCGRARQVAGETTAPLTVSVLGNPVGESAQVLIKGAAGQAVQLRLVNSNGQLVEQRGIEQAAELERQIFDLQGQAAGVLLLYTTANGQTQTIKMLRAR